MCAPDMVFFGKSRWFFRLSWANGEKSNHHLWRVHAWWNESVQDKMSASLQVESAMAYNVRK